MVEETSRGRLLAVKLATLVRELVAGSPEFADRLEDVAGPADSVKSSPIPAETTINTPAFRVAPRQRQRDTDSPVAQPPPTTSHVPHRRSSKRFPPPFAPGGLDRLREAFIHCTPSCESIPA